MTESPYESNPTNVMDDYAAKNEELLLDKISAELNTIINKPSSVWANFGGLAISLFLFISLGLMAYSVSGIAILVGVIFIHECGHLIGMKLLNYKDVKMFFIPFFGAAASGLETTPSGNRRAIVSLLGPTPGIFIGICTGLAYFFTGLPLLLPVTRMLLILNAFNLMPFHPLDGGRIFDAILFSRTPKLELGFKIVTSLILAGLAYLSRDFIFGFFAFMIIMSLKREYVLADTAHTVRKEIGPDADLSPMIVPREYLSMMVAFAEKRIPATNPTPNTIAVYCNTIWQRVRNKPCTLGPAIALLFGHLLILFIGIFAVLAFEGINYHLEHQQEENALEQKIQSQHINTP